MPPAHRRGDIASGHGCHFPPTAATGGSADVFVNGIPLMRKGDAYAPHACVKGHSGPHDRALAEGSASVFVNDQPAGRKGDPVSCGGAAQTASSNVFIGDRSGGGGVARKVASILPAARKAECQRSMAASGMPFVKR